MARVVLVGKGPPARDGIATFLAMVRDSLSAQHDVVLVNLTRPQALEGGRFTGANAWRTLRDGGLVWRASRSADIVHVHSAIAPAPTLLRAGLLGLAGRLRGARVVVHAHGGLVQRWLTTPGRRLLARMALSPAHRIVAVSEGGLAALAHALPTGRVVLIRNGVDPFRFSPEARPPRDPPRILYVGVLSPRKGLLDLIEASAILHRRGVRHELVLAGGAPPEGAEAEAAVRAAATTQVRFVEPQPYEDMPMLYRRADVFCLPSHWEAMPLSLLEAMASELPVVATPVGDIPRMIEDRVGGILVPVEQPDSLADALQSLLLDPEERGRMGRAGRRRVVEQFSAGRMVAEIDALYRRVARRDR